MFVNISLKASRLRTHCLHMNSHIQWTSLNTISLNMIHCISFITITFCGPVLRSMKILHQHRMISLITIYRLIRYKLNSPTGNFTLGPIFRLHLILRFMYLDDAHCIVFKNLSLTTCTCILYSLFELSRVKLKDLSLTKCFL